MFQQQALLLRLALAVGAALLLAAAPPFSFCSAFQPTTVRRGVAWWKPATGAPASSSAVCGPLRTVKAVPPFTLLKDAAAHFPGSNSSEGSSNVDPSSGNSSSSNQQSSAPGASSSDNTSSSRSNSKKSQSLLRAIDDAGLGLKPRAARASAKASLAETKSERILYVAKSCALYALFILYRAYRGLFIIAPAVFRATCEKLESVVDEAPFDDDDYYPTSDDTIAGKNKKYPSRTRITVSILAAIVTASYMVGGALRVALKLVKLCASSRDVPKSLEAAAAEQERNEAKILRLADKNATKDKSASSSINGEEGFAP